VRGAECDYYGEDCREEGETFLRGGGIMDYVNFYRAIREYAGGKISRQRFVLEWELEQRRQGIKEAGT
jgi:hypothetical protein